MVKQEIDRNGLLIWTWLGSTIPIFWENIICGCVWEVFFFSRRDWNFDQWNEYRKYAITTMDGNHLILWEPKENKQKDESRQSLFLSWTSHFLKDFQTEVPEPLTLQIWVYINTFTSPCLILWLLNKNQELKNWTICSSSFQACRHGLNCSSGFMVLQQADGTWWGFQVSTIRGPFLSLFHQKIVK